MSFDRTFLPVATALAVTWSATVFGATESGPGCLQPLAYVEDLKGHDGIDMITRNKVENLVEEARQLCGRGEAQPAQMKFRHAVELLEAAIRTD